MAHTFRFHAVSGGSWRFPGGFWRSLAPTVAVWAVSEKIIFSVVILKRKTNEIRGPFIRHFRSIFTLLGIQFSFHLAYFLARAESKKIDDSFTFWHDFRVSCGPHFHQFSIRIDYPVRDIFWPTSSSGWAAQKIGFERVFPRSWRPSGPKRAATTCISALLNGVRTGKMVKKIKVVAFLFRPLAPRGSKLALHLCFRWVWVDFRQNFWWFSTCWVRFIMRISQFFVMISKSFLLRIWRGFTNFGFLGLRICFTFDFFAFVCPSFSMSMTLYVFHFQLRHFLDFGMSLTLTCVWLVMYWALDVIDFAFPSPWNCYWL